MQISIKSSPKSKSSCFVALLVLATVVAVLLSSSSAISSVAAADAYYDATADDSARQTYYQDFFHNPSNVNFRGLQQLLTSTHKQQPSYDTSRQRFLYPIVDRQPDARLRGIYSNITFVSDQFYNCEHTVPQSWFDKKEPMRGDMHHLYTEDPKCNSYRSNYLHIDRTIGWDFTVQSSLEGCGTILRAPNGGIYFEPSKDYSKYAISRSVLYFLVRYPGVIDRKAMTPEVLNLFKKWAKQPLLLWERHRNFYLGQIQGNRNPFIDNPQLIDQIDFTQGLKG